MRRVLAWGNGGDVTDGIKIACVAYRRQSEPERRLSCGSANQLAKVKAMG